MLTVDTVKHALLWRKKAVQGDFEEIKKTTEKETVN